MEIKVNAKIDYDFEKAEFFLAEPISVEVQQPKPASDTKCKYHLLSVTTAQTNSKQVGSGWVSFEEGIE
jgi:hypothetical protein